MGGNLAAMHLIFISPCRHLNKVFCIMFGSLQKLARSPPTSLLLPLPLNSLPDISVLFVDILYCRMHSWFNYYHKIMGVVSHAA